MDQRHSRLVRRHHPHRGTHFPDRRLVPLGQATSDHLLGADPRSPRRLRPTGPALHRPRGRPDPGPGVGLSCVGNWRSPSRRRAPIWAWRPSASGPTWPSLAPPPSCWVSSPGPPWPPTPCKNVIPSPNVPRPGTTSRRQLSWTPSPWCDAISGWHRRVYHCPQPALDFVQKLAEL